MMKLVVRANLITVVGLSLTLLLLLLLVQQPHVVSCQASGSTLDDIQTPSSLNLKNILEHQKVLATQCDEYQRKKLSQLEQLRKISQHDDQLIHLQQPLTLELPAVCLFVFGLSDAPEKRPARLELVKWIVDEGDFSGNKHNVSKREAAEADSLSQYALLSDQLFAPIPGNSSTHLGFLDDRQNQVEPERAEQERQVEEILSNSLFQEAVEENRQLISNRLSPVILVPGLLSSRLQARLDKSYRVNILCSKKRDWHDIWFSARQLLPIAINCWLDNVRLELDVKTGYTKAPPGVDVRVPDFGSVESVRHLDNNLPEESRYFASIIERYLQLGYEDQKTIFAAPYDFRLAPQELSSYILDLRQLIERAHSPISGTSIGKRRKVTLICHSMGCTHLLVFLRLQSAAWRQSRIRKLIALSSPWGGAIKAVKALVVGDELSLPLVSDSQVRQLAINYPSIAFLLPLLEVFGQPSARRADPGGPVLVQTPERAYRVADLPDLLMAINLPQQLRWFKESSVLIKPLEPLPDLKVDCIHSLNVPTPETLIFRNQTDFPDGQYELVTGDGDGTVNFESLMVCSQWAAKLPDKVNHKVIMNTNHVGVLSHRAVLNHITNDVLIE